MQDQKTLTLTTVLSEVLANLAFMFTDDGEFEPPVGQRWLETVISYEGSVSGSLRLACTATFTEKLAANLLGMDSGEETTEQESIDAVKEFMNVVCGQYVTTLCGAEEVFNLGIPEAVELTSEPGLGSHENQSDETAVLSVEGQWLKVLHIREP